MSEIKLLEHEEQERMEEDYCFHQNYLESEHCTKCNPHWLMNDTNFRGYISDNCRDYHVEIENIYHCEKCSPTWPYCELCMEFHPFIT